MALAINIVLGANTVNFSRNNKIINAGSTKSYFLLNFFNLLIIKDIFLSNSSLQGILDYG